MIVPFLRSLKARLQQWYFPRSSAFEPIQELRHRLDALENRLATLEKEADVYADLNAAVGRKSRLLMIYDLSIQPFSIGDILMFQEASLILRQQLEVDRIDFALHYDVDRPACPDPAFSFIDADNLLTHMNMLIPAAQFNPYHGSLFVFDSREKLQRFVQQNADFYHFWPHGREFRNRRYLYYVIFNHLIHDHFERYGSIPRLGCRPLLRRWAEEFQRQYVQPHAMVTVQVRNNPRFHHHRNTRFEAWCEFFRHCRGRYPVKFVVICARSEVDDNLREHDNVLIAKDYATTVEQDLALVESSAIHMGASSGPGTVAWFNEQPYLITNSDIKPDLYRDIIEGDGVLRFRFARPWQWFTVKPETGEQLIRDFAQIWGNVRLAA
ncbi:MAG: hypothetical protein KatS3mg105_4557 [Gemmatales bacterium]|nr:MAG: hypothetical protein KatS3mg105_4557 [Gemmatales bacterium]